MPNFPGSEKFTADGVVGISGKPVRLFSIIVHSGATAGEINLYNGTGTGDPLFQEIVGDSNTSKIVNYTGGLFFPNGLYYEESVDPTHSVLTYVVDNQG